MRVFRGQWRKELYGIISKVGEKGGSIGSGKEGKAREKKIGRGTRLGSQSRNFQEGRIGLPEPNTFLLLSK